MLFLVLCGLKSISGKLQKILLLTQLFLEAKMPLFGSRMVCETANYKYIEKRDKKFAKRENVLRRYVRYVRRYVIRLI